jgi:hypothetical protein
MATSLWPWLVVVGMGALHGLNPASGWMLAAAWGLHARDRRQALRALLPLALGHVASIVLVAGAVALGLSMDRAALQAGAGALFAVAVLLHLSRRMPQAARAPAGHAGLVLWSFTMSTAHGAGLMLVPALIPLCTGTLNGSEPPLLLALLAVGLHTAAMLAVAGVLASGACRGFTALRRRFSARAGRRSARNRSGAARSLPGP